MHSPRMNPKHGNRWLIPKIKILHKSERKSYTCSKSTKCKLHQSRLNLAPKLEERLKYINTYRTPLKSGTTYTDHFNTNVVPHSYYLFFMTRIVQQVRLTGQTHKKPATNRYTQRRETTLYPFRRALHRDVRQRLDYPVHVGNTWSSNTPSQYKKLKIVKKGL